MDLTITTTEHDADSAPVDVVKTIPVPPTPVIVTNTTTTTVKDADKAPVVVTSTTASWEKQ